jgi:hypothetical protein
VISGSGRAAAATTAKPYPDGAAAETDASGTNGPAATSQSLPSTSTILIWIFDNYYPGLNDFLYICIYFNLNN